MSGAIIPLFPKKSFTATGAANVENDEITSVDVTQYTQAVLEVRLHPDPNLAIPSGGSIEIIVEMTAPSAEDPGEDFVIEESPRQSVTFDSTDVSNAPVLKRRVVNAGFGGFVRVRSIVSNTSGNVQADLSAQLVAKS